MEPLPATDVLGPSLPLTFVHRYYLLLKAHYFLFFSAFGMLYPILSITLRSRGLSTTEISYMNMIIPFLVFFTNPLMGFAADQSRRFRLTFNLLLTIVTILYCIMFLLPPIKSSFIQGTAATYEQNRAVLKFCGSQEIATTCASRSECGCSYWANCTFPNDQQITFAFSMNSNETRQQPKTSVELNKQATCSINYEVPIDRYLTTNAPALFEAHSSPAQCVITCSISYLCQGERFAKQNSYLVLYWLIFIVATNLLSNAITLGASIGFATLLRPEIFGQQRVWGTIGFGLSAFAASRVRDYFKTDLVYIIMFSIATTLCILVTSAIRIQDKRKTASHTRTSNEQEMEDVVGKTSAQETSKEKKKPKSSPFNAAVLFPLLKRTDVIVFLSLTLIWGTSYAALDPYLYLYIDEIAPCGSRSIIGWMSLIAASAEVVALFASGRMLKLIGTNASSVIILLAFAVRFGGYYFIRRPYFLLFMETMHYFNFGILYVLIAQKADSIAPPGLSSTLQGLVYGVSFGLGRGVGLIVSSFIYTHYESRRLFLIYAIYNTVAAVLYSIYFLLTRAQSDKPKRTPRNTNVPTIVIESDTNANEEPLLGAASTNKSEIKSID